MARTLQQQLQDANLFDYSLDELIDLRQRLAQTANRQMRRWAASSMENKPSAYTRYAKAYLRQYTNPQTGEPLERFHTGSKPIGGGKEWQQRRTEIKEINAMLRYMNAPTYTTSGYKKAKQKAVEGLAKAAGLTPGSEEYNRLIKTAADSIIASEQWNWLKRTIGSDAILEVSRQLAKGTATKEEVVQRINEMTVREMAGVNYKDMPLEDVYSELGFSGYANTEGEDAEDV